MSKQTKFINRKSELQFLKTAFESTRAEFIVLYGRRRIGKTELIKESIKNKNAVYFFAEEAIEQENINTFKKIIASKINNPILEKADLSWEEIFDQIPKDD
ncbi:MAG: ATP-binding protein, partial [Candidatus Aenigmarchaeota archaeon]|nr:ATP-binding protein [Candidatus Aenigmarchaeota archaeon]